VGMIWAPAAFCIAVTPDPWPVALMLGLMGLPILLLGLKVRRTRLRYENAEFELTATPRIGGRLEGTLHLPHGVDPDARVRATLVCQREAGPDSPDPVLG